MKTSDVFMVIVEKPVPRFKCHPCNEFMRLSIDFEEPDKKYNYCRKCGRFGEITPRVIKTAIRENCSQRKKHKKEELS